MDVPSLSEAAADCVAKPQQNSDSAALTPVQIAVSDTTGVTALKTSGSKAQAYLCLTARDVKLVRDTHAEAKLERIASWSSSYFNSPADFDKLPGGLQAVFSWFFKHLRSHREALSLMAKTLKPWEEIIQQSVKDMAVEKDMEITDGNLKATAEEGHMNEHPQLSHGGLQDGPHVASCTLPGDMQVPEDSEQETVMTDSVCFGSLSLNWMVQTKGKMNEHDHRLSKLEENAHLTRTRLDKIVSDALKKSHTRPQTSNFDRGVELLCELHSPHRQGSPDPEDSGSTSTYERRQVAAASDDLDDQAGECNISFSAAARLATLPARRTVAMHGVRSGASSPSIRLKKDSPTRSFSSLHESTGVGTRTRAAENAGADSIVNLVTRSEYIDLQDTVASLTEALSKLKFDVEKDVHTLHCRVDELERLTTTHFSEIRESARAAAANIAKCDHLIFEKRVEQEPPADENHYTVEEGDASIATCDQFGLVNGIEQEVPGEERRNSVDEGPDAETLDARRVSGEQRLEALHGRICELEKMTNSMPQDIKDLQVAVSSQQTPTIHQSSSDLQLFEALRSEACDAAREHAERVAVRTEVAVEELKKRLAGITDVQVPSQAQERTLATLATHERAGVHKWSCSTRCPQPPSSLADGRRSLSPDRICDTSQSLPAESRPGSRPGSRPASATMRQTAIPLSRAASAAVSSRAARLAAANAGAAFGLDVKPPPRLKSCPQSPTNLQGFVQSTADIQDEGLYDKSAQAKEEGNDASIGSARPAVPVSRQVSMLNPTAVEGKVDIVQIGGEEHNPVRHEAPAPAVLEETSSADGSSKRSSLKSVGSRPSSAPGRRLSARGTPLPQSEDSVLEGREYLKQVAEHENRRQRYEVAARSLLQGHTPDPLLRRKSHDKTRRSTPAGTRA